MIAAAGGPASLVRRIVTGHDAAKRTVIRSDDAFAAAPIPSADAAFALIWTTENVPADNNDETDGRAREAALTLQGGSVIRVVDMILGGVSPMHRTDSIDYDIVVSGEVELELNDWVRTLAGLGTIIVQRGTMHLWRNLSADKPSHRLRADRGSAVRSRGAAACAGSTIGSVYARSIYRPHLSQQTIQLIRLRSPRQISPFSAPSAASSLVRQ